MSNILDFLLSMLCGLFGFCEQDSCEYQDYSSNRYIVCSYAVKDISVGLFLRDGNGEPFGGLSRLEQTLDSEASMLMNGGMYHDDLDAVGLYIEAGKKQQSISTKSGWGNFHLLPNGVFWGKGGTLAVSETKAFIKQRISPDFATQSGPMLVINGRLHPRFLRDSDSRKNSKWRWNFKRWRDYTLCHLNRHRYFLGVWRVVSKETRNAQRFVFGWYSVGNSNSKI